MMGKSEMDGPTIPQNLLPATMLTSTEGIPQSQDFPKTNQQSIWTMNDHSLFLKGLETHGHDWTKIAETIEGKTMMEVQSHAFNYFAQKSTSTEGAVGTCQNNVTCSGIQTPYSMKSCAQQDILHHSFQPYQHALWLSQYFSGHFNAQQSIPMLLNPNVGHQMTSPTSLNSLHPLVTCSTQQCPEGAEPQTNIGNCEQAKRSGILNGDLVTCSGGAMPLSPTNKKVKLLLRKRLLALSAQRQEAARLGKGQCVLSDPQRKVTTHPSVQNQKGVKDVGRPLDTVEALAIVSGRELQLIGNSKPVNIEKPTPEGRQLHVEIEDTELICTTEQSNGASSEICDRDSAATSQHISTPASLSRSNGNSHPVTPSWSPRNTNKEEEQGLPKNEGKRRETWTELEHNRFLEGLERYGRKWEKIQKFVGTKTRLQVRTHGYGYLNKLMRDAPKDDELWEVATIMSSMSQALLKNDGSSDCIRRKDDSAGDPANSSVRKRRKSCN